MHKSNEKHQSMWFLLPAVGSEHRVRVGVSVAGNMKIEVGLSGNPRLAILNPLPALSLPLCTEDGPSVSELRAMRQQLVENEIILD